jgi:iron complex outermembrane receptor protein
MKGSFLFARDRRLGDWLQQMPAHRVEAEWSWYWGKQVDAQTRYLRLSVPYVFEQTQVPTSLQDYLPPPPAYALVNLNFATPLQIWKQSFTFGVTVYNLLNERYRDYMNRFRYFNDEVGRNIHVRLTYKF